VREITSRWQWREERVKRGEIKDSGETIKKRRGQILYAGIRDLCGGNAQGKQLTPYDGGTKPAGK